MFYKTSELLRGYNHEYYQRYRKHLLEKQREKNRRLAGNRRKWLVEYKRTLSCARYGENHPATLTFHHKKSLNKSFEIGNAAALGVSLQKLIAEIEKCEVLCADCHAKRAFSVFI
jgi:hypothetical protein